MTRSNSLLLSGAGLAMAAALLMPSAAQAQAFNATPSVVQGAADIDRSVRNRDLLTIHTQGTIIDWTPYEDGSGRAKTFLPHGNTAIFQNSKLSSDFSVLNRILPSTNGDVAIIDGTVIGRIKDYTSGTSQSGGFIAFYSPNGIVVGNSAVFDVGQLLLTTLALDPDDFPSSDGYLRMTGAPGQTAGVRVASGAQISASDYVAIAAPRIAMNGTVDVDGSVAYVAGEQVNLRFNGGLFDIEVPVGTSVDPAIWHTGTTTGAASTSASRPHKIHFVAKGQGNPVAMLLGGNIGFAAASSASIDNGDIVLSAGYDVSDGQSNPGMVSEGAAEETIRIVRGTNFTSSVDVAATGWFTANSANGAIDFAEGLRARAARGIGLLAANGNDLAIAGNPDLRSAGYVNADGDVFGGTVRLAATEDATLSVAGHLRANAVPDLDSGNSTGGNVSLVGDGGAISIGISATLTADSNIYDSSQPVYFGRSFGGTALVEARNGGSVTVGARLNLSVKGVGESGRGRSAIGGDGLIRALSGGSISAGNSGGIYASAQAGTAAGVVQVEDGFSAQGGTAQLLADGGTIEFHRISGSATNKFDLDVSARGSSGAGTNVDGPSTDTGGFARGGVSRLVANDGSIGMYVVTDMSAHGFGGQGGSGGGAAGGRLLISAKGASTIHMSRLDADVGATGGRGFSTIGSGGRAAAGSVLIETYDTAVVYSLDQLNANAVGGNGNSGGNAVGGTVGIHVHTGTKSATTHIETNATGGNATVGYGGSGGNATAGSAFLQADGSLEEFARITGGGQINAEAQGGDGGPGDGASIGAGNGGNGTGALFDGTVGHGGVYVLVGRDNASVQNLALYSNLGTGGAGGLGGAGQADGIGGTGRGGTIHIGRFAGGGDGSIDNGRTTGASFSVVASGTGGGRSDEGTGGAGYGGLVQVIVGGGPYGYGSRSYFYANGSGGSGEVGGDGFGGSVLFEIGASTQYEEGDVWVKAQASGGQSTTGQAGNGFGGDATLRILGDATFFGELNVISNGSGGLSSNGFGGNGTAGTSQVLIGNGGSLTLSSRHLSPRIFANGNFGPGYLGNGNATAGIARIIVDGGTLSLPEGNEYTENFIELSAAARTKEGTAEGGAVIFKALNGAVVTVPIFELDASATKTGTGTATGGTVEVEIQSGSSIRAYLVDLLANGATTAGSFDVSSYGGTLEFGHFTASATGSSAGATSRLGGLGGSFAIGNWHSVSTAGDLVLRDISAAGSLGSLFPGHYEAGSASVDITAGGTVRAEGTMAYHDVASTDAFNVTADRLEIVTPGSIRLTAPDATYAGQFTFEGSDFWMADADTIAQLAADPTFDGRNALLATAASGSDSPLGYLRTGDATLITDGTLLVRNTGTAVAPGGITVTGTLGIGGGSDPVDLFAYGRKRNGDGTFVTGSAFYDLVDFNAGRGVGDPPVTYTDGSQFNDCNVNAGTC
ncbi:hypothetical protein K3181_04185 [Qipengyuania sp. YG27]|uniref:Filamentous haemagglutinin FhaB/tRNA nuclease CdiA-like TPS domain-containing protein n=1 Tax=Qipengyuania mesophila TaxID=2867246 RepID=A0ABS7JSQ9_9SPHN|nr:hypothetical protein [Qipengyuania mesophila]MBX7500634.1 hypothetical protein [Qipengyuania mesophila]